MTLQTNQPTAMEREREDDAVVKEEFEVGADEIDEFEINGGINREKIVSAESMTRDEACVEMEFTDHDFYVFHRTDGSQPVPNHKIHECGHQSALFSHAAVLRGYHSGRGVSGMVLGYSKADAAGGGN